MSDRFKIISEEDYSNKWYKNFPVELNKSRIMFDIRSNKILIQLKFTNISIKTIDSLNCCIQCFDVSNQLIETISEHIFSLLNSIPNSTFGDKSPILANDKRIRKIIVTINKVTFADGTIWENDGDYKIIDVNRPKPIKFDDELGEQLEICLIPYKKVHNALEINDDYWRCVCGRINDSNSNICTDCKAGKDKLETIFSKEYLIEERNKAISIQNDSMYQEALSLEKSSNDINKEANLIKAIELYNKIPSWKDATHRSFDCSEKLKVIKLQKENEIMLREMQIKKQKRKIKFITLFASSLTVITIGAFTTALYIIPTIRYEQALRCFNENNYEQAKEIFTDLGAFKDSNQFSAECQKYITYNNAKNLFDKENYSEARDIFISLDNFENSEQMVDECEKGLEYLHAKELYDSKNYEEAVEEFKKLDTFNNSDEMVNQCKYEIAKNLLEDKKYDDAIAEFKKLDSFNNSDEMVLQCKYEKAINLYNRNDLEDALDIFVELGEYKNCKDNVSIIKETLYKKALNAVDSCYYFKAYSIFNKISEYKDSQERKNAVIEKLFDYLPKNTISASSLITVAILKDGSVISTQPRIPGDSYNRNQSDTNNWNNVIAVSAGSLHTVGLKNDKTVIAVGDNDENQCDVSNWSDIIAVEAGSFHTVGLHSDGTVIAVGDNYDGECDVSSWRNIVAISSNGSHTVGLRANGTAVATGWNHEDQCNVGRWKNIKQISAGISHTVGLKTDGTVVAVGYNEYGQCDVSNWTNIVSVVANGFTTIGIKADGTVVATGYNKYGLCDKVQKWNDIIEVDIGDEYNVFGVKSDGSMVYVSSTGDDDVADWKDIKTNN